MRTPRGGTQAEHLCLTGGTPVPHVHRTCASAHLHRDTYIDTYIHRHTHAERRERTLDRHIDRGHEMDP